MKIASGKQVNLSSKQQRVLQDQNSASFGRSYFQLCQLYSLPVLSHIINHEPDMLSLDVDKVHKDEEWSPILMALKKNRDLVRISIFSESNDTKHMVKEVGNRFQNGGGPVKTVFRILPELMGGIRDGLLFNHHLRILDISGIALREVALKLLAKGIMNNTKIQYLSFSRCRIGDSGVFILAPSIRTVKHLRILNFSGCCLTEKGAHIISAFLKSLAVRRQADLWAHSLRLSPLDTDPSLPCPTSKDAPKPLKRLIMCQNELGDKGAAPLFDLLYEEVGLGALDLHNNNLTNKSGLKAVEVLKVNRDLVVLDLKGNRVDGSLMNQINHYLIINEKARQLVHPGADHDFVVLDERTYLKPILFGEQSQSRAFMPTKSSIAKFNIRLSQQLTHDQRKKLLIHARPKSAGTQGTTTKDGVLSDSSQKAKAELLCRIQAMRKIPKKQDRNDPEKAPILSPSQKQKSLNTTKRINSEKKNAALDDFQEIDKVLDALDSYYGNPMPLHVPPKTSDSSRLEIARPALSTKNRIVVSIPPGGPPLQSFVKEVKKIKKAPKKEAKVSTFAKPEKTNSKAKSMRNVTKGAILGLADENVMLKRRVDELETLVSNFLNSMPVPPTVDHSSNNKEISPPISNNAANAPVLDLDYRPLSSEKQRMNDSDEQKAATYPPLLPVKIEYQQQQPKEIEQVTEIKSVQVESSIEQDILKIQGALKQTPSSIYELIHTLESSLFGVQQTMDRLKI